jgi:hypothetical protein
MTYRPRLETDVGFTASHNQPECDRGSIHSGMARTPNKSDAQP